MYHYNISLNREEQPEWFRTRLARIIAEDIPYNRTWLWNWNDTYEYKLSIREGKLYLVFEQEQDMIMFILKEV